MGDEIDDLGRRLEGILGNFSGTQFITLEERTKLEKVRVLLSSGSTKAEKILRDYARKIPDEVVSYTEFLELIQQNSPLARLEQQLRSANASQAANRAGSLHTVLGIEVEPDVFAEREKYAKLSDSIVSFPQRYPRRTSVVVDEYIVTHFRNRDTCGFTSLSPPAKFYVMSVDNLNEPVTNNETRRGLEIYTKICLATPADLQALIEKNLLINGLWEPFFVGDLVLPCRPQKYKLPESSTEQVGIGEPSGRVKFGHRNFSLEIGENLEYGYMSYERRKGQPGIVDFEHPFAGDLYTILTSWVTEDTLKTGLAEINKRLIQKNLPELTIRAGRTYLVQVNAYYVNTNST